MATGDLPRYQALSLIAHGVSAMVDLATFAAAGANPLMLNDAQWVTLARKAATAASTRPPDLADEANSRFSGVLYVPLLISGAARNG